MCAKFLSNLITPTLCRPKPTPQPSSLYSSSTPTQIRRSVSHRRRLPTRVQQIENLKKCVFDVLVIGGGITGTGCALDAVTRGLRTALIEGDDYASGASSKTTKLMFGDMNALRSMILSLNQDQYKAVRLALRERAILMDIAPHLIRPIPILVPIYNSWEIPYYWLGLKCYDLVAGSSKLGKSQLITKRQMLNVFPMLKDDLQCGMVYFDGLMNDARMCVSLALTAAANGASICNHLQLTDLLINEGSLNRTAVVRDSMTGSVFEINARSIVNATGPFTDVTRHMENNKAETLMRPMSGSHIVLPARFCSRRCGLHDPYDREGHELYLLPWQGQSLAGTTRMPCDLTKHPRPTEVELNCLLDGIRANMSSRYNVSKRNVISAWSGIRPLVGGYYGGQPLDTRDQIIEISKYHLITITGGKFSLYRSMAEEAISAAISACKLKPKRQCVTADTIIYGSQNWTPHCPLELVQFFDIPMDVARHLSGSYGTNALLLLSAFEKSHNRLHQHYPFIEAEVHYACIYEYAVTLVDVIARRLPLAFIDVGATLQMLPKIVKIMAQHHKWTDEIKRNQIRLAKHFLEREMGLNIITHPRIISREPLTGINVDHGHGELLGKS